MADVISKRKRSQTIAAIRSKGNKDTELKLAAILRAHGIKGWRRHRPLPGKPDFIFPKHRLAVFVDGCSGTVAGGTVEAGVAFRNIRRCELSRGVAWPVESRIHFQDWRLPQGN